MATRPNVPLGTGGERFFRHMVYLYVLYSDGFDRFYVGISDNTDVRLKYHNSGKVKSTKPFKPWRIVHIEEFENKQTAREREKYLKSAAGRRWRKNNIKKGD